MNQFNQCEDRTRVCTSLGSNAPEVSSASDSASKSVLPEQKRVQSSYAKLSLIVARNCLMFTTGSSAKALVSKVWQMETKDRGSVRGPA